MNLTPEEAKKLLDSFANILNGSVVHPDLSLGDIDDLLEAARIVERENLSPCIFNSCTDCQILSKRYLASKNHKISLSPSKAQILSPNQDSND